MNRLLPSLSILLLCVVPLPVRGQGSVIYGQYGTLLNPTIQSAAWQPTMDLEAADDFVATGTITAVTIAGSVCYQCVYLPAAVGAFVRFYDGSGPMPGALQQEFFVASVINQSNLAVTATLPSPFVAVGRHFVSVELVTTGPHGFGWRTANLNAPVGAPAFRRDRTTSSGWQTLVPNASTMWTDLSFELVGSLVVTPPATKPDPCGNWTANALPLPAGATRAQVLDLSAVTGSEVWAVGSWGAGSYQANNLAGGSAVWRFDGTAWSTVSFPSPVTLPSVGPVILSAVKAFSATDVWIAGSQPAIVNTSGFVGRSHYIAHWNGASFSLVGSGLPQPAQGEVNDIYGSGSNDVWFVGSDANATAPTAGATLHWDGIAMTAFQTPRPTRATGIYPYGAMVLRSVNGAGPNDVWAVGTDSSDNGVDFGFVLHYDGSSWSELVPSVPSNTISFEFLDVVALPQGVAWVSGSRATTVLANNSLFEPYVLFWDGTAFQEVGAPAAMNAFVADGPDDVTGTSFYGLQHGGSDGFTVLQQPVFATGVSARAIGSLGPCRHWVGGSVMATPTSEPQPTVFVQVPACGSLSYGPQNPAPFALSFNSGSGTSGTVSVQGGAPGQPAIMGVSSAPDHQSLNGSSTILIDVDPGNWFFINYTLSGSGTASFPINLGDPQLALTSFYLQTAHAPIVLSNGLRLLFCP